MTAVDTGSGESAVTYETQQHGVPSRCCARGQPATKLYVLLHVHKNQEKHLRNIKSRGSPFRFRCIARSTVTVTGKDSSMLISVCWTDVISGVVLEDLFFCLRGVHCLGVVGEEG